MFGWISRAAASASRWKRDTNAGSEARCSASSFTRDVALEALVEREMHGRHAARPEPALEPVAPGDQDVLECHQSALPERADARRRPPPIARSPSAPPCRRCRRSRRRRPAFRRRRPACCLVAVAALVAGRGAVVVAGRRRGRARRRCRGRRRAGRCSPCRWWSCVVVPVVPVVAVVPVVPVVPGGRRSCRCCRSALAVACAPARRASVRPLLRFVTRRGSTRRREASLRSVLAVATSRRGRGAVLRRRRPWRCS